MAIPIENIYYLLCYAWNKLDEKDRVAVSAEDCTALIDLLAKVLINATRILLKRGIDRSYLSVTSEYPGIKGKLQLSETVKRQLLLKQKTVCSFDEFSSNVLTNQILVSTLRRLIRTRGLEAELKDQIKNLVWNFPEVETIELNNAAFSKIRLHRNNKFYGFILNVCRLIYENSLLSEKTGDWQFSDFTRDERKMNRLYEDFLFNFYKIEQNEYRVRRENIDWQFDDGAQKQFLPLMKTDMTLESSAAKIIIDAKYYRETLKSNYGAEKINSSNLYQLFSYLINQRGDDERTRNAAGILLYPTIEQDYDLEYQYQGHQVYIKTVNLNDDWRSIEKRLKGIIKIK